MPHFYSSIAQALTLLIVCVAASQASARPGDGSTSSPSHPTGKTAGARAVVQAAGGCVPGPTTLCLNGGRFRVELLWATVGGTSGAGQAVAITPDTGYFWFFDSGNVELVVKVLEACSVNGHRWVFAAGLTDVDVTMKITDTVTGNQKTYRNPQGTPYRPLQETSAFPCDHALQTASARATGEKATATASSTELLLNGNRFEVIVDWRSPLGTSGRGEAVALTGDTGYFWFFDESNVEVVIKVLDACSAFDRFWVFAAGLTDVEVEIEVTDTFTGISNHYVNPLATPFQPILDTGAFATCATQAAFELFSNPGDALLLRARTAEGVQIDYFGDRDERGIPLGCSAVETHLGDGEGALIQLDDSGRPVHALASNGVAMDILWLSDHQISFSASSPDGSGQVSVLVDLLSQQVGQPFLSSAEATPGRRSQSPDVIAVSADAVSGRANDTFRLSAAATAESRVMVNRCGQPVNGAFVRMHVTPEVGAAYTLPATPVGAGQYRVILPSSPSDGAQRAGDICAGTANALGLTCTAIEPLGPSAPLVICGAVAAAIAAGGGVAAAPAILKGCTVLFTGVIVYCQTLGQGVPGGPSIAEVLCAGVPKLVDRFFTSDVVLQPSASIPASGVFTAPPQVSSSVGPFPDFTITAPGEVQIGDFFAVPPDPAPFQGYTATVEILCAPPSTLVQLSIVGTDGYVDSTTCVVTGDSNCSLVVPGAEAGVVDRVSAQIFGGPSRQIIVVF